MITDALLSFTGTAPSFAAQSFSGTAASNSTGALIFENAIDLTQVRALEGEPLHVVFTFTSAVTLASGTITGGSFALVAADTVSGGTIQLTTVSEICRVQLGGSIPNASFANRQFVASIPSNQFFNQLTGAADYKGRRYIGVTVTLFTSAATPTYSFSATAVMVKDVQNGRQFYPSGFSIA
jgi:hypothetical protein